jgi:hypothetical protein
LGLTIAPSRGRTSPPSIDLVQVLPRHALVAPALVLAAVFVASACNGPSANSSPTPTAAPSPTPDSHLREPARADVIYSMLFERGLTLIPTNASVGRDPERVINATYAGWPLVLLQYRTSGTRQQLTPIKAGESPGKGDAPFTFAGLNVVVEWGPKIDNRAPRFANSAQVESARTLAAELDRLIGPLAERSTQPVAPRLATPAPTAKPATPAPTRRPPTPRPPTPRPTR